MPGKGTCWKTGRVTGPQGGAFPRVHVTLLGPDGSKPRVRRTGRDGSFRFARLTASRGSGGYSLYFAPNRFDMGKHVPVFYKDSQSSQFATPVQVHAGSTTHITRALSRGLGSVSGTVTDAGGDPVENVSVQLTRVDVSGERLTRTTSTAADGTYSFTGVRASAPAFTVCFDPSTVADQPPTGYAPQCYDGTP
jgi:hypothetical protein